MSETQGTEDEIKALEQAIKDVEAEANARINSIRAETIQKTRELNRRVVALRNKARETAIADIRRMMAELDIPVEALAKATKPKKPQLCAKYRDPMTGNTWSGMGKPPKWIKEHPHRESLRIAA